MKGAPNMFDRPANEFSLAEKRIQLTALAGPMRFMHGSARAFQLAASAPPVEVAQNRGGHNFALYVELRPRTGFAAPLIVVGPQTSSDPSRAITVDLAVEPFKFGYILLPAERLYVRNPSAQNTIDFLVFRARV